MDADDLANQLLTLAGTIMEDTAPVAVVIAGDLEERITTVRTAGQEIVILAEAARIVKERG